MKQVIQSGKRENVLFFADQTRYALQNNHLERLYADLYGDQLDFATIDGTANSRKIIRQMFLDTCQNPHELVYSKAKRLEDRLDIFGAVPDTTRVNKLIKFLLDIKPLVTADKGRYVNYIYDRILPKLNSLAKSEPEEIELTDALQGFVVYSTIFAGSSGRELYKLTPMDIILENNNRGEAEFRIKPIDQMIQTNVLSIVGLKNNELNEAVYNFLLNN